MREPTSAIRWLLWAYPAPYRRRHGAEIVTTLLEMAESGAGRPTAGQKLHLIACGVRQRLRLPAQRPLALIAAAMAAVAVGALGAAAGTWLGWQTAAPVPSAGQMRSLTAAIDGNLPETHVYPSKTAMQGPTMATTAYGRGAYSAGRVRDALTSAGWRVTTYTETTGSIIVALTEQQPWHSAPATFTLFRATKDGLTLSGETSVVTGGAEYGVQGQSDLRLDVWATNTAAVPPLAVAGLLVGALGGWLLAAALAYRLRRCGRARRRVVIASSAVAFAAAAIPVYHLYRDFYQVLVYDRHAPNPYVVDSHQLPPGLLWTCTGIALLALAVAALLTARPGAADPDPAQPAPVITE